MITKYVGGNLSHRGMSPETLKKTAERIATIANDNPNEKAYSCWTEVADVKTHYSPTICPRGHYCDSTTKTKSPCPAGKYNINIGEGTIAQCNNCEDGFYNPIEGQAICPFQCGPGTYGDHQGAVAANVDSCKPNTIMLYFTIYGATGLTHVYYCPMFLAASLSDKPSVL